MDKEIRQLRYNFFKLSPFERLQLLIKHHLVTTAMAETIPLDFFKAGLEQALVNGNADRLANDPWIKEQENDLTRKSDPTLVDPKNLPTR